MPLMMYGTRPRRNLYADSYDRRMPTTQVGATPGRPLTLADTYAGRVAAPVPPVGGQYSLYGMTPTPPVKPPVAGGDMNTIQAAGQVAAGQAPPVTGAYRPMSTGTGVPFIPTPTSTGVPLLPTGGQPAQGGIGPPQTQGGGGESLFERLLREYQESQTEARTANEQRYQEILQGYQDRYNQAMQGLEGMGAREREDIESRWRQQEGRGMQDLVSSGLMGTTVAPTMRASYGRQATADVGRLEERLRQQRLGLQTGLSGEQLGFMERREDVYPDYMQLIQLAGQMGQGGGGRLSYPSAYAGGGRGVRGTSMAQTLSNWLRSHGRRISTGSYGTGEPRRRDARFGR